MAPPKAEHLFTLRGYLSKDTVEVGSIKPGPQKIFAPVVKGWLTGPALGSVEGVATPGGGDWLLVRHP